MKQVQFPNKYNFCVSEIMMLNGIIIISKY